MAGSAETRRVGDNAVLVIGGRGVVGARVVAALEALGRWEVWVGSRNPSGAREVCVDLTDPSTFSMLDRFLAVVNCADVTLALPDAAADHCLRCGAVFVQPTGDLDTLLRLRLHARAMAPAGWPGLLVLGAGLHPGLSGVLAATCPGEGPIDLAVHLTPNSVSGRGMRNLWAQAVTAPHYEWSGDERELVEVEVRELDFIDRPRSVMSFPLADGELLHRTQGTDVSTWLSVGRLTWLLSTARRLSNGRRIYLRRAFASLVRGLLWLMQPFAVVRNRVGIRAQRGDAVRSVLVDDALAGAAACVAAITDATLVNRPSSGVVGPEQYLTISQLKPVLEQLTPGASWRWAARG